MHSFLDSGGFAAMAHRGGALEVVENTLEAFEHAAKLGYRYIETDVQLTSDGVIVIFHDDVLDRLTSATGQVKDHTWAELKALRVHDAGRIPRLEEVLEAWPAMRFNIDAKTEDVAAPLCRLAPRYDLDRLCLASSSDKRVGFIRSELGDRVCTAGASWEVAGFILPVLVGLPSRSTAADCFQVPLSFYGLPIITPPILARTRQAGKALHVWTIDEEAEMDRLIGLGVDGIMTDRPGMLKSVLERRGIWHKS